MGEYVMANGVRTYYEVYGQGDPVVLLHGGGVDGSGWFAQVPVLAQQYRVYVPERRGHGRTPDMPGPITHQAMADDTAAFLRAVDAAPAHVIGWSDGGAVALSLAIRHPELVSKLVSISAYIDNAGATAATMALFDNETASQQFLELLRPQYEPLSPDGPEHFPIVAAKLLEFWRNEPGVDMTDLPKINVPTLLMQGDDDCVKFDHLVAMYKALPHGQLAVVPGTSHILPIEKPDLVNKLLLNFLADNQPAKMMPLGDPA